MADEVNVPLREYFEARIGALQAELTKAERELSIRLEAMNEFRAALRDTQGLMATRELVDSLHENIDHRLRVLENRQAYGTGYVVGIAGTVAAVISVAIALLR